MHVHIVGYATDAIAKKKYSTMTFPMYKSWQLNPIVVKLVS